MYLFSEFTELNIQLVILHLEGFILTPHKVFPQHPTSGVCSLLCSLKQKAVGLRVSTGKEALRWPDPQMKFLRK